MTDILGPLVLGSPFLLVLGLYVAVTYYPDWANRRAFAKLGQDSSLHEYGLVATYRGRMDDDVVHDAPWLIWGVDSTVRIEGSPRYIWKLVRGVRARRVQYRDLVMLSNERNQA